MTKVPPVSEDENRPAFFWARLRNHQDWTLFRLVFRENHSQYIKEMGRCKSWIGSFFDVFDSLVLVSKTLETEERKVSLVMPFTLTLKMQSSAVLERVRSEICL
jgi:hypothetical protein